MPQVLAVDWDQQQARYVLANISGRKVRVRALGAQDLAGLEPQAADEAFGRWIKAVLKKHKVRGCRLLVGLPRSSVEMLPMTLPPAADGELPELVANQAMQESAAITEDTLLDFYPAPGDPLQPRQLTVAALSEDERGRIARRCVAAGFKPRRMVLRSMASISLFRRLATPGRRSGLIVNRVGCEVDLNVVQQGRPVFFRTVRLPDDIVAEEAADRLLAEVQRTLFAVPSEALAGQSVDNVYLIGGQADYESLAERIEQQRSLSAEVLDPFAVTEVLESRIPPHREHFAPLLGILLDEAADSHPIDFLHPRRPAKRVSRWRLAGSAAGLVAAVALLLGVYVWGQLAAAGKENAALRARLNDLNVTARKAVQQKERIEAIAAWKARDVNWLDELRDLSLRFPGARDAVVQRLTMRPAQSRGAVIDMQGLVRDPNIVVNMERQIRHPLRNVRSRRIQQRSLDDDYTWLFETSLAILPRRAEQYREPPVAAPEPGEPDPTLAASAAASEPAPAETDRPLTAAATARGSKEGQP